MSARCSSRREFHQSWSCKRAGSPEISEESLSPRMAIKSTSFSSGFGTVKPVQIFVMLQSESTAANQFTVASKSICSFYRVPSNELITHVIRHGTTLFDFKQVMHLSDASCRAFIVNRTDLSGSAHSRSTIQQRTGVSASFVPRRPATGVRHSKSAARGTGPLSKPVAAN
jgi:hypothetical protein